MSDKVHLNVNGLDVGVAVRNYGRPVRYTGSGLLVKANAVGSDRLTQFYKVEPMEADLPMLFELGASYTILNMINVSGSYESNNFEQDKYEKVIINNMSELLVNKVVFYLSNN